MINWLANTAIGPHITFFSKWYILYELIMISSYYIVKNQKKSHILLNLTTNTQC